MVKRLIWSDQARDELKAILLFWDENNQSTAYSKKLFARIIYALELTCENNFLGKATSKKNVRTTTVDSFLVYYEVLEEEILVLSVFDGRRNPFSNKIR